MIACCVCTKLLWQNKQKNPHCLQSVKACMAINVLLVMNDVVVSTWWNLPHPFFSSSRMWWLRNLLSQALWVTNVWPVTSMFTWCSDIWWTGSCITGTVQSKHYTNMKMWLVYIIFITFPYNLWNLKWFSSIKVTSIWSIIKLKRLPNGNSNL